MISVITGDIINSRKAQTNDWQTVLKDELGKIGQSPKTWEIYRGDSFQLEIAEPSEALINAIKIKAALKSKGKIDIRMSIGLGEKTQNAPTISESSGSAFINSGDKFELLKKEKQNLAIKTDSSKFDKEINLYLKLSLITMDRWTENSAEIVNLAIENPNKSQEELGKLIGIKQTAVSLRLNRAHFEEILEVNEMYKSKLQQLK
jgi:SatD family (SatD)